MVDAVRCAIEVQSGMVERNAGVPEDRRIEFRIGIHLGDVVEESDGDLMGDGVNIAARLEGVAKPGGDLSLRGRLPAGEARLDLAVSRSRRRRSSRTSPSRSALYSLQVGVAARAKASPVAASEPRRASRCPTSPRSPCCRSRT